MSEITTKSASREFLMQSADFQKIVKSLTAKVVYKVTGADDKFVSVRLVARRPVKGTNGLLLVRQNGEDGMNRNFSNFVATRPIEPTDNIGNPDDWFLAFRVDFISYRSAQTGLELLGGKYVEHVDTLYVGARRYAGKAGMNAGNVVALVETSDGKGLVIAHESTQESRREDLMIAAIYIGVFVKNVMSDTIVSRDERKALAVDAESNYAKYLLQSARAVLNGGEVERTTRDERNAIMVNRARLAIEAARAEKLELPPSVTSASVEIDTAVELATHAESDEQFVAEMAALYPQESYNK